MYDISLSLSFVPLAVEGPCVAKTIEVVTKAEKAYRSLRRMIVARHLRPGEPVVHRHIAKRLGMSTIPVIEAVRKLESEGLLRRKPHSHSRVSQWDPNDHLERLYIREGLEGVTARLCAERATDAQVRKLEDVLRQLEANEGNPPYDPTRPGLDAAFHLAVARFSGLRLAEEELGRFDLLDRTMSSGSNQPLDREMPLGGHRRVFEAIAARDGERAEGAMREHLRGAIDHYKKMARELNYFDDERQET